MPNDDTTGAAVRPSSTTLRLFNGLGGVELGVRQSRRKAMVFIRVRKIVVAMWWKGDPGAAGRPVAGRPAVGRPDARLEVLSGRVSAAPGLGDDASQNAMQRLWRRFSAALRAATELNEKIRQ